MSNVYVKWMDRRRLTAGTGEAVWTSAEETVSLGNFDVLLAYVEVIEGGDANTKLTFHHGMEESGKFFDIDSAGITLNGRAQDMVAFEKDESDRPFARFLKYKVVNSSDSLDVTLSITLLLKR